MTRLPILLKAYCAHEGINRAALAREIGVAPSTLMCLLDGITATIADETVQKISDWVFAGHGNDH